MPHALDAASAADVVMAPRAAGNEHASPQAHAETSAATESSPAVANAARGHASLTGPGDAVEREQPAPARWIRHHCGRRCAPLLTRVDRAFCVFCDEAFRIASHTPRDAHVTIARTAPPPAYAAHSCSDF